MKTIIFNLKPESQGSGWKETLELTKIPNNTSHIFVSNTLNDVDGENKAKEGTNEWYKDSEGILYPKEFLDKHYDEVKQ